VHWELKFLVNTHIKVSMYKGDPPDHQINPSLCHYPCTHMRDTHDLVA
jgi:hypothetical protein